MPQYSVEKRNIFIFKFFNDHCMPTLRQKGHDYSQGDTIPANQNFTELAKELKTTPLKVWYTFFRKHVDSICQFTNGKPLESESIESRIVDAVNYLLILASMIEEEKENGKG